MIWVQHSTAVVLSGDRLRALEKCLSSCWLGVWAGWLGTIQDIQDGPSEVHCHLDFQCCGSPHHLAFPWRPSALRRREEEGISAAGDWACSVDLGRKKPRPCITQKHDWHQVSGTAAERLDWDLHLWSRGRWERIPISSCAKVPYEAPSASYTVDGTVWNLVPLIESCWTRSKNWY